PFVPPPNAPLPGQESAAHAPAPVLPLYEQAIAPRRRDEREAGRRKQAGYEAFRGGNLELAATEYRNAFVLDPTPELSLMLGEVYWARGITDEARGWWRRHLRDDPASKARPTLLLKDPGLLPDTSTP
ncbi:MAG: serine/threonine protein kinase, partial [Cystobacter sp.]